MENLLYTASIIFAILFRYQIGLVNACKIIGVKISDHATETGYQDAITPPSSTNITLLLWAFIAGLFLYTIFGFGWREFSIVVGVFLVGNIVAGAILIPSPNSTHFVRRIYHSMTNRWADYEKQNDTIRADSMKKLIESFEDSFGDRLT